jgi:hypothetical protein
MLAPGEAGPTMEQVSSLLWSYVTVGSSYGVQVLHLLQATVTSTLAAAAAAAATGEARRHSPIRPATMRMLTIFPSVIGSRR